VQVVVEAVPACMGRVSFPCHGPRQLQLRGGHYLALLVGAPIAGVGCSVKGGRENLA
jgi:hypothetical protein